VLHGRYRVLQCLTRGGMGVVYRGERLQLGRPVAIKFLHESYAAADDGKRRFEVEARAMSRLAHPNCVAVTDFGVDQGAPYLVMDFVPGQTLRDLLAVEGRLPPSRALDIIRQVLAGVAHAHGHQIVHRDLKPENVLVTALEGHGEHVRIVDFGLAKLRNEASVTTGIAVGTPSYMSPEQTMGSKVDERADIYATGVMLYELLVGHKPFHASSPFELMRMHREVPPTPLARAAPDMRISQELEAAIQRALAKEREDRFPSAAAFLAALDATPEAHGRSVAHGRPALLLAAVAAVAAAGAGIWWLASH
jgi:eukaryotic-like serine/threonine-protein kinase